MAEPKLRVLRPLLLGACLLALAASWNPGAAEAASWRNLTGRVAPDLTFAETGNGLAANTRLSSYRGRRVVLLVFWLRDCVQCKRDLPKVQQIHERWASSGLQVISIVHKFTLAEVTAVMRQRGWSFPIVRDPTGQLASLYGGGRRPGYYIIGIDGRVKASNGMPDTVLRTEVGRWRLKELGRMPVELEQARTLVYHGDYGAALRSAEQVAATAGARAEVTAAVGRLATIARGKLQNRVDRAETWYRRGATKFALAEYAALAASFKGTSLARRAQVLYDKFRARVEGRAE